MVNAHGTSFTGYVDDLQLHSFPTRRSSDLSGTITVWRATAVARSSRMSGSCCVFTHTSTRSQAPAAAADSNIASDGISDRKSTRLNSSHGYISYAVFCLKKKNDSTNPADQD